MAEDRVYIFSDNEYFYEGNGNRIRRETEQEITTYRYDNCNRLQELHREYKNTETAMAQPQIIRYTYDRQGNMLSEGEKKYSYAHIKI